MEKYYFVPNNVEPKESEFYFVFEERIKDFTCVELKGLKEFSKKYPNIKLYKENLNVDEKTLKYLEENFDIKHLEKYY